MQAVKALYKKGKIQLLEPLQDIEEAELFIIVLDNDKKSSTTVQTFNVEESNSDRDFKAMGLNSFFNIKEDNSIDCEMLFDVKVTRNK